MKREENGIVPVNQETFLDFISYQGIFMEFELLLTGRFISIESYLSYCKKVNISVADWIKKAYDNPRISQESKEYWTRQNIAWLTWLRERK